MTTITIHDDPNEYSIFSRLIQAEFSDKHVIEVRVSFYDKQSEPIIQYPLLYQPTLESIKAVRDMLAIAITIAEQALRDFAAQSDESEAGQ